MITQINLFPTQRCHRHFKMGENSPELSRGRFTTTPKASRLRSCKKSWRRRHSFHKFSVPVTDDGMGRLQEVQQKFHGQGYPWNWEKYNNAWCYNIPIIAFVKSALRSYLSNPVTQSKTAAQVMCRKPSPSKYNEGTSLQITFHSSLHCALKKII